MLQKRNQHRRSLTNVQYFKIIVKTVKNQNIINTNEHKQKKTLSTNPNKHTRTLLPAYTYILF